MEHDVRFEDLYAFRAWVRALAARLASDDATSDDIEQQVWTAALERPPRDARNLKGWLGAVVRNAARNLRRSAARRGLYEASAPAGGSPRTPDELAAEAEAQRALVRAVLELDEPYRGTILLRWFEGLTPTQVAARQGVPVATVHTRLARAHAQLRDRLDRGFGGRAAWTALLLAPWDAGPGTAAAPGRPQATAGSSAAPSAAAGGALMAGTMTKLGAAVAVLAAAALLWRVADDGADGATNDAAGAGLGGGDATAAARAGTKKGRAAVPLVPATGAALDGADPESDLAGVVVDKAGAPVAGAELTVVEHPWTRAGLRPEEAMLLARDGATTRSEGDGTFRFRLRRGDSVSLRARAAGFATTEHVLRSAGERTRIVLERAVGLDVVCTKDDGTPAAGMRVRALTWPPEKEPRVVRNGVSGADGKLAWDDLPPAVKIHLHPAGWGEGREVDLPSEGRVAVTLPFDRTSRLSGRVVDDVTGAPVAGATVDVERNGNQVLTGADGTFVLDDGIPGRRWAVHCTAPGYARAVVHPGDAKEVTFRLRRGVRFVGRAVGADGAPVADALVAATAPYVDGNPPRMSSGRATSGADGRFVVADLARDMDHGVVAAARGHAPFVREVKAVLDTDEPEFDLGDVVLGPPRTIAGRVVAEGEPVARATVWLRPASPGLVASDGRTLRRTDDRGRFRFDDLAPGRYVLGSWGDTGTTAERTVELPAGSDLLDIVLGDASDTSLRLLVVTVLDGDGKPVAGASVTATDSKSPPLNARTTAAGTARLETPRRRCWVQASPPDAERAWLPPSENSSRQVDRDATEVRLVLAVGAWIEGTLLRADGSRGGGITVSAVTQAGRWVMSGTDAEGRFRLAVPASGNVDLVWNGQRLVQGARGGREVQDSREFAEVLGVSPGTRGILLRARAVADDASQRVRVVGPDGAPVAGIGVWARDLSLNDPKVPNAKTDAEGRATLSGLPDRRHRFGTGEAIALAPSRWVETTPGREPEIVLTLRATREIRGTMTDPDGRPFTEYESGGKRRAASPWARSESASGQAWYQSRRLAEDGSFTILVPDDDPGPFTVEFNLPPEGEGVARVQRGDSATGVVPGGPEVRLVIRPRTQDD